MCKPCLIIRFDGTCYTDNGKRIRINLAETSKITHTEEHDPLRNPSIRHTLSFAFLKFFGINSPFVLSQWDPFGADISPSSEGERMLLRPMSKNTPPLIHSPLSVIRILGIDPGTATTGWAVIEAGKDPKAIAYGCIETSPQLSDADRLREIAQDLETLCKKYRPDEATVEKLFFFKNQKTIIQVAQGRGAILLTLARNIPSIAEYTPLQIKQALTGYGRAEKRQMQEMVKAVFELPNIPKPDDAADALAVAFCHASSRKTSEHRNM